MPNRVNCDGSCSNQDEGFTSIKSLTLGSDHYSFLSTIFAEGRYDQIKLFLMPNIKQYSASRHKQIGRRHQKLGFWASHVIRKPQSRKLVFLILNPLIVGRSHSPFGPVWRSGLKIPQFLYKNLVVYFLFLRKFDVTARSVFRLNPNWSFPNVRKVVSKTYQPPKFFVQRCKRWYLDFVVPNG